MSICRAQLRKPSNALTRRMSGEQIHVQVPPKLFRVNSLVSARPTSSWARLAIYESSKYSETLRQTQITFKTYDLGQNLKITVPSVNK